MPSAFSYPLEAASNVVITSVANGDALIWDSATSRWVNGAAGLTQEQVDDRVAALLVAGTNITLTYNDPAGTITIDADSGPAGLTLEEVDDHLATAIIPGIGLEVTYDDAANEFQFDRLETLIADTDGATITIDLAFDTGGEHHEVTLGGNRTLVFANPTEGEKFRIKLNQDATGTRTVTWPSGITWVNGYSPAQTPVPSSGDTFEFLCTNVGGYGTTYLGWILSTERPKIVSLTAAPFTSGRNEWQYATCDVLSGSPATLDIFGSGSVSAGTFTLTVDGETTAAIAYDATGWEIYLAILALPTVLHGEIILNNAAEADQQLSTGATITLRWVGYRGYNSHTTTVNSGGLTGGTYSATDNAASGSFPSITGNYKLAHSGNVTADIAVSDNAATIKTRLEALASIGTGNIDVFGGPLETNAVIVEFKGDLSNTNVSAISYDTLPTFGGGVGSADTGTIRGGVADVGNEPDIDWSVCQAVNLTLGAGSGTYRVGHEKPVPGTWLHVEITNSSATVSTFEWTGVTIDWDTAGEPTMPTTGNTLAVEFYAVSTSLIRGRTWYP